METERFQNNMSSRSKGKRSKRARHAGISSLLTTKSDEHEAICFSQSEIEEDQVALAANSLVMLANDESFWNPQTVASASASALHKEEPAMKALKRKKRVRTKKFLDADFDSGADLSYDLDQQAMKDQDLKYKCKTCRRKFATFQALGGHRASCYNKFKSSCDGSNNMHEEIEGLNAEIIDYEDDLQSLNRSSSLEDRRSLHIETSDEGWGNRAKPAHECPVCYRVFSSGQALGGHKRCHSTPPAAAPVGLDNSPCLSTIEEHRPVKHHGLLDLNMPPPVDEEDYCIENQDSVFHGNENFSANIKSNRKIGRFVIQSTGKVGLFLYDDQHADKAREDEAESRTGCHRTFNLV